MAVIIPSTLDEVKEHLNGLGKLVTAKEWERAAIVWAWTERKGQGARTDLSNSGKVGFSEFARLNIYGLRKYDTVAAYHDRWQSIIDELGDEYVVRPGDEIPSVEKPWREEKSRDDGDADSDESTSDSVPQPSAEDVIAAIRDNPEVAQQVVADTDARAAIARASFEYDSDAEEMANAADPQRAEMRSDVDSMRYREKMREWRRLGDELAAWTDHAELSESETRMSIADAQIVQNTARLIESKLSGQFDRDLSALLSDGE